MYLTIANTRQFLNEPGMNRTMAPDLILHPLPKTGERNYGGGGGGTDFTELVNPLKPNQFPKCEKDHALLRERS